MKLKKLCITMIIMSTILFSTTTVFAESLNTGLTTNKTEIQANKEEEIILNLEMKEFQEIKEGLYAYKGQIEYDKNVFYELETNSFETKNMWTNLKYNKENNEFVLIKKAGTTNPEEFLQIKLKVKSNAKAGDSSIIIKNQTTSQGKKDIEVQDSKIDIKVIQEEETNPDGDNNNGTGDNQDNNNQNNNNQGNSDQGNNNQGNNNQGTGNNSGLGNNSQTGNNKPSEEQNNQQNSNKPQTDIPKTGLGNTETFIFIAIEILLLIAIYSFIKYKKVDKKLKSKDKKIIGMILAIIITAQLAGTTYATILDNSKKGEVNDDGLINYTDVELIQKHLIGLEKLADDKLENADLNNDQKITVTDLTLLIKKIENKREYIVELENISTENYYPTKNQEIEISFIGKINYDDTEIKKIVINDKEYETQKTNEAGNEYKVKLNVGDKAEKKDFKFSKAILSTNEEVKIDYNFSVSVLKERPYIDEKSYKLEETFEGKANITFDLIDTENSIISAQFTAYEKTGVEGENTPIVETPIKAGNNKQEIPVKDGKTYAVEIEVDYNLAPEQLPENEYKGESIFYSKEFTVNLDYKFKIYNIQTLKNNVTSTTFTRGEQIQVSFDSTNAAFEETKNNTFKPAIATINGKKYQVEEKDNHFVATIDGLEGIGNQLIKIEKVKLENGKEFTLDKNNSIQVRIEEKKPKITNFEAKENITDKNIKIKFNIIDEGKAIESAKVVLYDSKNNIIESKELNTDEIKDGTIETTLKTKETTKYMIQVIASYRVTDTEVAKNKVLLEQEVPAIIYANIKQVEINKTEVEKNETINITYEIETNSEQNIEKIRVNSVNYKATKLSNGKYKITVQVGDIAGLLNLETTKIIFKDGTEIDSKNTLQVNILKDIPTISDVKQENSLGKQELTLSFSINDIDNSYINGKVQLVNKDQIVEEKEIIKNENGEGRVTFDHVEEGISYTAKVLVTYNRFTGTEEHIQKDQLLEEIPVILIHDYKLEVKDLKTSNKEKETIYFNKNEEITLSFTSTNASSFIPENVIINGKTYKATRKIGTDKYSVILPGYNVSGKQTIKIEKIILSNGVELELKNEQKIEVETLKDKPTITDFSYNEDAESQNKIKANFTLNDNEQTLASGKIIITDKNKTEIKTQDLQANNNEIIFDKTNSEYYYIKVVADYNLGTDENNLHTSQILLQEEMEFTIRKIEMKDVLDVYLYRKNGDKIEEVSSIYTYELAKTDQFLVKVEMKDMPSFYAPLKGYREENNILKLELEYENIVQYENGMKKDILEVDYGTVEDHKATNNSLSSLINRMKANPNGTFELTKDYDASTIPGDHRSLVGADITFRGTLNGNGHKIYNLSKPIFDYIEGATIKDLVLEDIYLSNTSDVTGRGALANETRKNTTISNVHVKNITITTSLMYSYYGGITGKLIRSTVKECSVTNLTITGPQNTLIGGIGGITGYINISTIENCYVTGSIAGKKEMGGIAGLVEKYVSSPSYIKNCIAKVNIDATGGPYGVGGIIGFAKDAGQINLKQNVSLATGRNSYKLYGVNATLDMFSKNYVMEESTLTDNNDSQVKKISKNDINENFFKKEAGFDESIWNLKDCHYDKLPTLNNSDPNNVKEEKQNTEIYIPEKERLEKMAEYNKNKEILYSNLYKLMPFYDAKYLVLDGTKISEDYVLNKKLIKTILPYDNRENLVVAITKENYKNLSYIKVVFSDNTTQKYTLKFKDTYGNIANYNINELNVNYNFDKYIIKQDATIISDLSNYIQNLEYEKDLQGMVTLDRGHPAYKEHFNKTVRTKENATNFIYKYLSNASGYSVTMENEILNSIIKNKLLSGNEMKRILFAYNYYSRFYGIDMNGANLSDVMLFKGELYRENTKVNDLISEFWNSKWKNSHVNYQFYRDTLAPRLGIAQIGDFIDYNIKILTDYKDPNDWFTSNFKGTLVEAAAKGYEDSIDYRAWTQLKKRPDYMLALLTLPENAGYMISTPAAFYVGSQRVYITDPTNKEQKQTLLTKMQNFANQVAIFYGTAAGFIESGYFNSICDIVIDTRFLPGLGEQSNGKTNDLFHKNFNEILNEWSMIGGVAAYTGSQRMYFVVSHTLDSYSTWTHETGHNQTARLFFKNNGFRSIGGGASADGITGSEDYTDGNSSQDFGDGDVNFNLSYNYSKDKLITTNLTPERINSKEKIESYYKRMFETIDFLDYVEAKAFLELTPEEQSKVAVQVYYPSAPNDYSTVGWKTLSKEEFEEMNLQTVDDLWKNQITIKPGVTGNTTQTGIGQYGSESMYIRRWYQPYNENGRTHTFGFKYTAWQMLGVGGYDNGYVTYYSGKSRDDLDAIRKITKDNTMTWEKFKKERYKLMEESWNTTPYLNADELLNTYVKALKTDAQNGDRNVTNSTNVRRRNYHHVKRVTDDFRQEVLNGDSGIAEVHIKTAEEFKQKLTENPSGYYVLDNDIDLSSLTGETAIIDGYFMGKIDGKGNKLTGNTLPIFDTLKFAHISNLNIENSKISNTISDVGALARKAEYSEIENVIGRKITVTSTSKQIGGLIGSITSSFVKNTHITESTVSGDSRVGVLSGYVGQSQVEESTANGKATSKGNATGGFIGEIYNKTTILNCYSVGEVKGNQDIGGFSGYVNNSSIINSFSSTKATGNAGTASFVGQTINNSIIKNNITLVNQLSGYKFDGRTANDKFTNFSNNYENQGNIGTSTLTRENIDFTGKISIAEESKVQTPSFYTGILNWNSNIWDFSRVQTGGLPKLKNSDPNSISSTVSRYEIRTANELETLLKEHPDSIFSIEADIDLSTLNLANKNAIITGDFMGRIEGNNHTLSGNTKPIFENLKYARISNLNIKESTISSGIKNIGALSQKTNNAEIRNIVGSNIKITSTNSEVGGLIGTVSNSTIENVHITNSKITGTNKVGLLTGYATEKTNIIKSSVNGNVIATGNTVGGLVGEVANSSKIENSYSLGTAQGNTNVGGLVGLLTNSSIVKCFSSVSANGENAVAGFVGKSSNNSTVQNNISLGNQDKKYKFDGATQESDLINYQGNYEYEENVGISTLERKDINFEGKINVATKSDITNINFYKNILGWSEEIWNLTKVTSERVPKLKNLDPNEERLIIVKENINSVDEFIEKLSKRPDGKYTIMSDLDFSSKTYKVGSVVIPGIFFGRIEGNGHTIKNLSNATIFEQFNGEVQNLNIENFQHGVVWNKAPYEHLVSTGESDKTQSNVAAFTKKSVGAKFYNMRLERVIIFGNNNLATMTSNDKNSTFEKINVTQAFVMTASNTKDCGNKASTFISEKTGGSIKNCYVQGEMHSAGNDSGAVIGLSHGNVTIENVVANIIGRVYLEEVGKTTGLFIGKINGKTIIKNSVSMGRPLNSNLLNKFAMIQNIENIEFITNCYENADEKGISNSNGTNIKTVTKEQLLSKEFYRDTLHFDENIWDLNNIQERIYSESPYPHSPYPDKFPTIIDFGGLRK